MASNFNNTTPAAQAGNKNVLWQTDGAGNDSAEYDSRFGFPIFSAVVGSNNQVFYFGIVPFASTFPASASLSPAGAAKTAATSSTVFTFSKNGTPFATLTFASSGTSGTWTQASSVSFNGTTDTLEIDGPTTADATLAGFGFTLVGYKT